MHLPAPLCVFKPHELHQNKKHSVNKTISLLTESELRKKIETERCEAERLAQEIDELQYLRQDSDEEIMSTSSGNALDRFLKAKSNHFIFFIFF